MNDRVTRRTVVGSLLASTVAAPRLFADNPKLARKKSDCQAANHGKRKP